MEFKVTYVTIFFDLFDRDRSQGIQREQSIEKYQRNWDLVLKAEIPIIIFAEEKYRESILSCRGTTPTVFIGTRFDEIPYVVYSDLIRLSRRQNPIRNSNTNKDTVNYTILMVSKIDFLSRAAQLNPFRSTHLAYIDLGIGHVARPPNWKELTDAIGQTDRVRLCCMRNTSANEIKNRFNFYSYLRGRICGGFITCPISLIGNFNRIYVEEIISSLALEIAPNDEQVLTTLVVKCPDLFNLYYGDYCDCVANYVRITGTAGILIFNLSKTTVKTDGLRLIEVIDRTRIERPDFLSSSLEVDSHRTRILNLK
jgi:hypothetical protein